MRGRAFCDRCCERIHIAPTTPAWLRGCKLENIESMESEILHDGWLEKKGRVMKNWKRRWFTLRANLLEYFDSQNGNKKGDIEITSETIVLLRDGSTHLFKFGIQTGSRILELSTSSDQDRIEWMDAIHNAVKQFNHHAGRGSFNDGRIKDRVSNLLSKKTNMDEDTPMNRALRGHATTTTDSTTPNSKPPPRRANRRPRNKKTTQASTLDRVHDCHSDDSDQEQETTAEASVDEPPVPDLPSPPPQQPLPEGWAQVMTEDGRIYYYHTITRVSRWDFPTEEQSQQFPQQGSNTTLPETKTVLSESEKTTLDDEEQVEAIVSLSVKLWLQPANMNRTRSIPELLTAIPSLLDSTLVPEGAISREPLTLSSAPSDVKKAYLRAIRLVHPDKLVGVEMSLEQKLLVQEVFIHISEKYDLYRKAHGI